MLVMVVENISLVEDVDDAIAHDQQPYEERFSKQIYDKKVCGRTI